MSFKKDTKGLTRIDRNGYIDIRNVSDKGTVSIEFEDNGVAVCKRITQAQLKQLIMFFEKQIIGNIHEQKEGL